MRDSEKTTHRRDFLKKLSALGLMSISGASWANPFSSGPKISAVDVLKLHSKEKEGRVSFYLRIKTESQMEGLYGPIDSDAVLLVDRLLKKIILGEDALAIGTIWEKMFRTNRHSRGSHYIMAMSAVDNTLWDLKGKIFGQPVFRLLGGTRTKLKAYGSCLGFSTAPEDIERKSAELKKIGYTHQKWFLRENATLNSPAGFQRDVESTKFLRQGIGDDADIMIDASRKWSLSYAMAWVKQVEQYNIRFLEEPLFSAEIRSLEKLAKYTSVPLAMGEHFYGRWDADNFLSKSIIQVVQSDPEWVGGISEMVKTCTIASLYGAQVIPHGHSMLAAMHLVASQSEKVCPLVEFLINKMSGSYHEFDKNPPMVENGYIELSERSGFGIKLDESKIKDMEIVSWREI